MSRVTLTPKQQRFVEEYLVDLNATQAAIRAGYSERTANEQAARLLVKVGIQEAIQAGRQAQQRRTQITADATLREIARVAFSDIRKLFRPDGTLKLPHELDDETAAFVASIETDESVIQIDESSKITTLTRKVKLWNKLDALGKLVKHLGLEAPLKYDFTVTTQERRSRLDSLLDALRQRAGTGRVTVPLDGPPGSN